VKERELEYEHERELFVKESPDLKEYKRWGSLISGVDGKLGDRGKCELFKQG